MLFQEFRRIKPGKAGVQNRPRAELAQGRPVKVVWMTVCQIEVTRPPHEIKFLGSRVLLEPPAAPVHRPDEPRVGGQQRFGILEHDQCGVCNRLQFVLHDVLILATGGRYATP